MAFVQYDRVFRQRQETCNSFSDSCSSNCTQTLQELNTWDTNFTQTTFFHVKYYLMILHTETVKCCGAVRPNRNGMPGRCGQKMKLMCGHVYTRARGNLTAII